MKAYRRDPTNRIFFVVGVRGSIKILSLMPEVTWGRGKKKKEENTVRLDIKFTNILGVGILYDFKLSK